MSGDTSGGFLPHLLHNGGQPARGSGEPKGLHIRGPRPGGQIDHGRAYDPMQRPDAGPGWFSPSRRPRKEHPCDAVALVGRSPASLPRLAQRVRPCRRYSGRNCGGLFGVDYALAESITLDIKARQVYFGSLNDGGFAWDPLRGHRPNLRNDGSEPVSGHVETNGIGMFGVHATLGVNPRGWTVGVGWIDRLRVSGCIHTLEFLRRPVAEGGVQASSIVYLLKEVGESVG